MEREHVEKQSLGNRGSWLPDANGPGSRLCLERFQSSSRQAISLVYRGGDIHLHHLDLCLERRLFLWRPLAEQERASCRRSHGWLSLWTWSLPRELFGTQAMVALCQLRGHWGNRGWILLHRANSGASQVVP